MSPVYATRRRAEEFHTLVEGPTGVTDPRLADALDVVAALRAIDPVQPRAEFTASLREELMSAADTLLLPSPDTERLTLPARRTARDRRIAAVVGGFAVVGATSSLAVAAQSALPGEMLYPLKRAMESAQSNVFAGDDARGASLLDNAALRLAEVAELSRTGDLTDGPAIASTLVTFSDQAQEASEVVLADYAAGGDKAEVEQLRGFTAASMDSLASLQALLPEEARDELVEAAQVLTEIDAAAEAACPSCAGGIAQVPSVLLSAGQVTPGEDAGTVVTGPVVTPATSDPEGSGDQRPGQGQGDGGKGDGKGDGSGEGGGGSILPEGPLAGGGSSGDGGQDDPTGPIDAITDPLTGGGGSGGSGGGGGNGGGGNGGDVTVGIDPLDDVVDDLDDGLADLP